MAGQINLGDLVTYDGIARERSMQRCEVRTLYRCGDLALRFPDGSVARCSRAGVTKIIAPQHAPDF